MSSLWSLYSRNYESMLSENGLEQTTFDSWAAMWCILKFSDYSRQISLYINSVNKYWFYYPTALKGFGVLFSPMASGWAGGRAVGRAAANILSGLDLSNYKG